MPQQEQQKKWPTIKCPHCGREYAPAELFVPGELIGAPTEIIRDAIGKIVYQEYGEDDAPTQETRYRCDGCGKPFVVEPIVTYKVKKEDEALDFDEQSVSLVD